MTGDLHDLPDKVVVALCIFGESRGEPVEGQIGVGCVIRNRLKLAVNTTPRWADICLAPEQFSCFNESDPNLAVIFRAADALMSKVPPPALAQAQWIAAGILSGDVMDNTHNATHYLTTQLLKTKPPSWAKDQPVLVTIGSHSFLRVA